MDATPPAPGRRTAGTTSRSSGFTPSVPLVLRRLAISLAGLALVVLVGAACALSFEDLRALAINGRAKSDLAYFYPVAFDVLLVVSLVSVPLLRGARLFVRLQAGFILLVLLSGAATASVLATTAIPAESQALVTGVALFPWVALAIGLWLLLVLLKHTRVDRTGGDDPLDAGDLVPFDPDPTPVDPSSTAVSPSQATTPLPQVAPTAAPSGLQAEPTPAPPTSGDDPATGSSQPPATAAAHGPDRSDSEVRPQPKATPPASNPNPATEPASAASDPAPAPSGREAEPTPAPPASGNDPATAPHSPAQSDSEARPQPKATPPASNPDPATEPASAASDPAPAPGRRRVRWGDLVRPPVGDVLVHPRPQTPAAAPDEPQPAANTPTEADAEALAEADPLPADTTNEPDEADTRPLRRSPHAAATSGPAGPQDEPEPEPQDHLGATPLAPPSGRMRSTPRPPK